MIGIDYVGVFIGIVGMSLAALQYIKSSNLRHYRVKKLRSDLRMSIIVMAETFRLCTQLEKYKISDLEAIGRIQGAHSQASSLVRSLFQELSEVDLPYDESRLKQYEHIGLISSKWLWQQAASFVERPGNLTMPDLPNDTVDWMDPEK